MSEAGYKQPRPNDSLQCPRCGHRATRVIDTHAQRVENKRRRHCPECGVKFYTFEWNEDVPVCLDEWEPIDIRTYHLHIADRAKELGVKLLGQEG